MMKVSFNEEANIEISDELTLLQRKGIWCLNDCETCEHGENTMSENENDNGDDDLPVVIDHDDDHDVESEASFKARRHRVRSFVRFVVDEYKSLKAMGINDTISLYRISVACSKIDAVKARERASNGSTAVVVKSTCCSSLLRKRLCSSRKTSSDNNTIQISSGGNSGEHER